MSVKQPVPARLFVLLAREAPIGVIIRRGPSNWAQLTLWDTQQDIFTRGQWFKGRIYERRCDLTPDGKLLVYFASKQGSQKYNPDYTATWTAVSKPPYFTALALWPKGDCWNGGGLFEDNKTLWLNDYGVPHPDHQPRGLDIVLGKFMHGEDEAIYYPALERNGWIMNQTGKYHHDYTDGFKTVAEKTHMWQKLSRDGRYQLVMQFLGYDPRSHVGARVFSFSLVNTQTHLEFHLDNAMWADFDQQNRPVLAKEGKVFSAAIQNDELLLNELADLNTDKPQPIESPDWAKQW